MKSLAIFCGASGGSDERYADVGRQLIGVMASRKIDLIYGAGSTGMMGVIADEMLRLGGRVTGVIPHSLFKREVVHSGITELIAVDSMHARKAHIYSLADGFVALPGGLGTMDEIFEIMTWAQLGLHQKPYGFLNAAGYFNKLLGFLDDATASGFISPETRAMIMDDATPEGLLQKFTTFQPVKVPHVLSEGEI